MDKTFSVSFVLFSAMIFALAYPVAAITINSVTVVEPDTFYSSMANNSVVRLIVNATGANNTPGNIISVAANFISLGVNCNSGSGSSTISLANTGGDLWAGMCDVGEEAAASAFKSGQIIVIANETYGSPGVNTDLILSIYNIGIPSGTSCYRFGEGTTNFNQVTNFNDVDITLVIEANDDSSCIAQGRSWDTGWLKVGKLRFNGVNFDDDATAVQKLSQLSNIVRLNFSPPKTYQNTRVFVDTVMLPELNVDTFNIELYHLSLMIPNYGSIISDNSVAAEAVTWTSNGFEAMMGENTYNLTFTVSQGFRGYNITDSVLPIPILYSPVDGLTTNATPINVNFTVNGTGTGVSKVFFYINGVMAASYNGTVNTANCIPVSQNLEVYNCVFTLTSSDGTYNLSVTAYDFGRSCGNAVTESIIYNVQTGAPVFGVKVPKNDGVYSGNDGSMLKISFNVSDGNGISSCWYSLDGPVSADDELIGGCVAGINSLQLYLDSGYYDLDLYANDTLGMIGRESVSFEVSDTVVPNILNRTVKILHDDATLSLITDEYAGCKYSSSDESYSRMNDDFEDNITLHTGVFDVSERDSEDFIGTEYIYYIRCSDLSGNANTESLVINLVNANVTNVSGNTVKNTSNVAHPESSEIFDLGLLLAGKKILNIEDSGIPFTDILMTTNSAVDDVVIKVTALSNSTITYPEKVYSYISVEYWAIKDSHIDDALIKFKVSKEWLADNNFSRNDIVLFRYDSEWIALNTTPGGESGDYITYTADSPGLSLFAISKKHVDIPDIVPLVNATNSTVSNETASPSSDNGSKKSFNWIWILLAIVISVIVALFILVERNERSGPPPIFPQDRTLISKIKRLFR